MVPSSPATNDTWRRRARSRFASHRGVLRDTTFVIGGGLVIAMGAALLLGLVWAGAGWQYASGWFGGILAIGFGAFFVQVGRAERAERRRFLRRYEPPTSGRAPPPG